MSRQQQLALGSGFGDQCYTAEIDDDEIDALNDETFGAEGDLGDDWEMEKLAEQTELATTADLIYQQPERNAEELLEESLSQLVDDDDDPMLIGVRKPRQQLNHNGTLGQTEFVKTNFANLWSPMAMQDDIWGFSPASKPDMLADLSNRQTASNSTQLLNGENSHKPVIGSIKVPKENGTQSLNVLLNAMKFNEKTTQQPPPMGLKGAKTVEELEAELKSVQAALSQDQAERQPKRQVPTCEDIEKELKSAHLNTTTAPPHIPFPPMGFGMPPPTGLPPGFPPLPPMMPPGGIPPSLMANPQFRAALMSELVRRQMAIRCGGPLPPVPPPPPFPGSPGVPAGLRLPPPMSDPSHLPPFMRQQIMQNMQRQNNLRGGRRLPFTGADRHSQSDGHHRNSRDPYAGFMSKREKEWLIKLQMLQLMSNNPFVDDYYATMYESKKLAKQQADGNGDTVVVVPEKDKDENDNNSHAYVPPTFEGSLGKVQYLSATCPRQLIDVSSQPSTTGDDSPTSSTSESKTPPIGALNVHSNFKRHREVLMEIENLYNVLLDLEDLQRLTPATTEKEKEKRDKMNQMESAFTSDRLATLLAVKKGRTLFARFLKQADSDQVVSLLKTLIGQMPAIIIKERNTELYDILYESVAQSLGRLDGTELSAVADTLEISLADVIMKSKFMFALWSLIVHKSATISGFTGNLWKEKIQLWAILAAECRKFRVADWLSESDRLVVAGYLHQSEVELSTIDGLLRVSNEE